MTTIDLDPNTPHDPDRTRQLADVAAESIRALNYATRGDDGLHYPGDAYALIGTLGTLAERLPQLCEQISAYLERAWFAGQLEETPDGPRQGDARLAVADAIDALTRATNDATAMRAALGNAQAAIGAVRYVGLDAPVHWLTNDRARPPHADETDAVLCGSEDEDDATAQRDRVTCPACLVLLADQTTEAGR